MATVPMSLSRVKVRDFVKLPNGAELHFEIQGNETTARKFVQSMRVELSRMRDIVRRRKRAVKPFTLSFVSAIENEETGLVAITLLKKSEHAELSAELNDILSDLEDGELLQ